MRIIAGKHRGRKIETPPGKEVRPTSEFAREAIFNILVHGKLAGGGSAAEGARVADVFCGTGAFGLEALSRGAVHVTFVDQSREALDLARKNAQTINELNACEFVHTDALQLPRAFQPHTLAFLDPPYHSSLLAPSLKRLKEQNWLAPGTILICECDERDAFAPPEGFTVLDERKYGRARIVILTGA